MENTKKVENRRLLVDFKEGRIPETFVMPSSDPPPKGPGLLFVRDRSVPYVLYRARIPKSRNRKS
jgi:hypothetical protein